MTTTRKIQVQPLHLIEPRRQKWAYQDLIPLRVVTILAGSGGIGKSTILAWFIAGLTRGEFRGDLYRQPTTVALIAAEDDPETTLIPRLMAAGADLERVRDLSSVMVTDDDAGTSVRSLPRINSDLTGIREALIETGVRVLIIDPVLSIMDGDSIKDTDVRRNLDPIAALANELDIAIVLVMHFNKGKGNASDKVSGSHAFRDTARSVLLLAVDDETNHRILSVDKSNYSPSAPSYAFDIETVLIATPDGDKAPVGRASLVGESDVSVHEIVRRDDDVSLGNLSAEILAYVNEHGEPLTARAIATEFDIPVDKARTYAARLVKSGRIQRKTRGQFAPNDTQDPSVPSVRYVMSDPPTFATPITEKNNDTACSVHQTPTLDGLCGRCAAEAVA